MAECLLAVRGPVEGESDDDLVRALSGLTLVAEVLRLIREALTKKE
jgi:hypothetical protein